MTDDISVSFKVGTGFDAPLFNFKGENGIEVQRRLVEFFGLGEAGASLTPFEAFVEAGLHAKAVYAASNGLGAKPVKDEQPAKRSNVSQIDLTVEPVKAPVKPDVAADGPNSKLLSDIKGASSRAVLSELFKANQAAFTDPEVKAAATKRSAELAA